MKDSTYQELKSSVEDTFETRYKDIKEGCNMGTILATFFYDYDQYYFYGDYDEKVLVALEMGAHALEDTTELSGFFYNTFEIAATFSIEHTDELEVADDEKVEIVNKAHEILIKLKKITKLNEPEGKWKSYFDNTLENSIE